MLLHWLDVLGVDFGCHKHGRRRAGVDGEIAIHSARLLLQQIVGGTVKSFDSELCHNQTTICYHPKLPAVFDQLRSNAADAQQRRRR